MITVNSNTKELLASLDETTAQLLQLVSSFNEKQINIIPFENSWTAGQVTEHLTKSNKSFVHALQTTGKPTDREPEERVPELKAIFLDFTSKLKSPEIVLPLQNVYVKDQVLAKLKKSIDDLKEAENTSLNEIIDAGPLGNMTKLEVLHAILYHTQRHINQLQNILQEVILSK